ncbi:helicase [Virgibacillus sp. NKC19-16]|uniref:helicase n=1 Tax=Virgibacillus salidurans TaxID=2831673 RepID=UPI001F4401C0|nr:helicase [Virgibacillus sp. NKC19-16]UJL47108.1 helicase [Virgibacillus sp. NKC19-16]
MDIKNKEIYPNCQTTTRTVEVDGLTKSQLINKLKQQSILMNEFGKMLFADNKFTTSISKYTLKTVELAVQDLGLLDGGTITQIFSRANQLGLELCPLELAPYLRLRYLDQPEGELNSYQQHQAPYGSITVASKILTEDDKFPKGFYLRCIDGVLWLRGYVCDERHVWEPSDHFIFVKE